MALSLFALSVRRHEAFGGVRMNFSDPRWLWGLVALPCSLLLELARGTPRARCAREAGRRQPGDVLLLRGAAARRASSARCSGWGRWRCSSSARRGRSGGAR